MEPHFTAFLAERQVAAGDADRLRAALAQVGLTTQQVLIFDDATGKQVDLDMRADAAPAMRGRGRPKLGVQPHEVTLLPRHWEWLAAQPGGASATLRRLVDNARRKETGQPSPRTAQDAAYHFLTAMAGDRPQYEAAIRALYAGDGEGFETAIAPWPAAIRDHGAMLAAGAFRETAKGN